jgi:hypothetical protein
LGGDAKLGLFAREAHAGHEAFDLLLRAAQATIILQKRSAHLLIMSQPDQHD